MHVQKSASLSYCQQAALLLFIYHIVFHLFLNLLFSYLIYTIATLPLITINQMTHLNSTLVTGRRTLTFADGALLLIFQWFDKSPLWKGFIFARLQCKETRSGSCQKPTYVRRHAVRRKHEALQGSGGSMHLYLHSHNTPQFFPFGVYVWWCFSSQTNDDI